MDIDPESVTHEIIRHITSVRVLPDPPTDFESFWKETRSLLESTPMDLDIRYTDAPDPDVRCDSLHFAEWSANSLGGRRIGGPLIIPSTVRGPQWVFSHGYGTTSGCHRYLEPARRGLIALGYDVRGYNRSRRPEDPGVPGWATWGIEDPSTYVVRGAVADAMRAVQVARSISGADPRLTILSGGSLSGGIAALAAPWIPSLAYLPLRVPTFGAFRLREGLAIHRGTGFEINTLLQRAGNLSRDRIRHTLRYFDSLNAAPLVRGIPVTIGLGISDVVVPAETIASVYHAIGSDEKELLTFPCSHCRHPLMEQWKRFEQHILSRAEAICFASGRERSAEGV